MKRSILWLLTLTLLPGALAAQERDFAGFRDSLAAIRVTTALDALDLARRRDSLSAPQLVERGLIALRKYEITSRRTDSDRAKKLFNTATDRYPALVWAHFGLGLALATSPDVRIKSPFGVLNKVVVGQSAAEILGLDARSRARRSLRRALELDPHFLPAAIELAQLALEKQSTDDLEEARDALRQATSGSAIPPRVATALANVEAALGNLDAANAAADAAIVEAPNDPSAIHARAVARLRTPGGEDAGARAYFEAIEQLTPAAAEEFYTDLIAIVTDEERDTWEQGDLAARKEWLKSFWDVRAARAGVSVAERVADHYRRLAVAKQKYRRKSARGADPAEALLHMRATDKLDYDDRGIIYIRHGKPENVVTSPSVNLRPNESWVYHTPEGKTRLLNFVALHNSPDFRLVDNILLAIDMTTTGFNSTAATQLLEDRTPYDARYSLLLQRVRTLRGAVFANAASDSPNPAAVEGESSDLAVQTRTLVNAQRMEALAMVESDSDHPKFDRELPFFYDVYTFKGEGRRTDVTAALAIPGDMLQPATDEGLRYAVKLSLIVVDSVNGRVERKDTTISYAAHTALGEGQYLRTQVDVRATPSKSAAHRVVAQNGIEGFAHGQLYGAPRTIPDYSGSNLMLSDIVLAEPEEGGSWHRGGLALRLVPPRQFPRSRPLSLFYEIYNLPAGTKYRTEIAIEPTEAEGMVSRLKGLFGGERGLRFSFEGTATDSSSGSSTIQELRKLSPDLKPGKYRIQVSVTNLQSGEVTENDREFVVMK